MRFRMTLEGYFKGSSRECLGGLGGGLQSGEQTGLGWGLDVKLRSESGQGLVKVWFGLQLEFNSLELDTVLTRLTHGSTKSTEK